MSDCGTDEGISTAGLILGAVAAVGFVVAVAAVVVLTGGK